MEEQIQAILEKYTDDLYYESPEGIDISDVKLVKKELTDLFSLHGVSQQRELLFAWEQYKKANWYESDAVDVEKMLMSQFLAIYSG